MTQTASWTGQSGQQYEFHVYPAGHGFKKLPGLYMFVKRNLNGRWSSLYVGQTSDFKQRIDDGLSEHQAWPCATNNGATHIAAMVFTGSETERLKRETDLRRLLNPVCNKQ